MWIYEGSMAKLDLSKVRSDFNQISQSGLTLICPKKSMWNWEPEERFLRSIVVNNNGYVVSCSWPKFGNYGEFLNDTEKLKEDLETNAPVKYTHKEDGTLCIRSVIDGKVIMRTRGTLFGGEFEDGTESFKERFFRVAKNKYPRLLDENWMTDRSLLFEYVSPDNLIVIKYKEEDLVFLGYVNHSLHIGNWSELENISKEGELNLVRLHDLPRNTKKLLETIKTWKDEGIVVRCDKDQVLVKIKSAHYLAQHRMKFSINYRFIVEFIELSGIKTESELVNELRFCDYDFEIIQTVLPFFYKYKKAEVFVDNIISQAKEIVDNFSSKETTEHGKRKELAISITNKGLIRPFVFSFYDKNIKKIFDLRRKIILDGDKL